jgi:uncharacterized SAM-binding protein YcdF (DUF218 family)
MRPDKKRHGRLVKGLLILILLAVTHPFWLPLPAKLLLVRNHVKKADAIIILSGDWNLDRERKASELYREGFADKIIRILERENRGFETIKILLDSAQTQNAAYLKYFALQGVPRESVILGGTVATSTFNELRAAKAIVEKNNFKSIMIVTSDYHMRRALMTARWFFKTQDIRIYNVTVFSKNFHPRRWWLREDDIRGVVFEFLGICLYVCYHFVTGR